VASAEVFLRLAGGAAFWTLATSVLEVAAAPSSALVTAGVARCIAIAAMPGFTAPAAAIGAASVTFTFLLLLLGALHWLVFLARHASTRDFYPALTTPVTPVQVQNIFFPCRTLFYFMCRHRPATWAGSRAGSPVSKCVPCCHREINIEKELLFSSEDYLKRTHLRRMSLPVV
jgi:hypothetical protein